MKRKNNIPRPKSKGHIAKVPIIIQLEAMECGAASLAMVLSYYGKWLPLERLREECGVSRDGASAKNIKVAAKRLGLEVVAFKLEPEDLRDEGLFPCIVHMGFSHFVVVNGIKNNTVFVNDPSCGLVKMTLNEFDKHFTGVTLFMQPGESFFPEGKRASVVTFARERLRGTAGAIALTAITTVLASAIAFINPAFGRVLLDEVLTGNHRNWIVPLVAVLIVVRILQLIVTYIKSVYLLKLEGKMAIVGNSEFFWHMLNLPMAFFSQRLAGDLLARQETNSKVASSLISTIAPLLLDALMLCIYFFILLSYSPVLTVLGLASVLINALIAEIISKKRIDITRKQQSDAGKKNGMTFSGIRMITTIKSSGAENGFFMRWAGYQAAENVAECQNAKLDAYLGNIPQLVTALINMMILGVGVYLTFTGNFTIGMLLAFQGFIEQFFQPVNNLIQGGQDFQEMRVNMERIDDVMKYETDPIILRESNSAATSDQAHKLSGNLEVRNVSFGYSPMGKPVLKDFNLTLKPGRRVALVGASGCGKSTVAKLLSGLYAPWEGTILYDGKPISDIPRSLFSASVAVVDQDITLFEDTIRANIKMWDHSIEDFEMIMATRDASLHEDIMRRKGGYDGTLLESGADLSGGQRQRMEIARVLAQDPSIIILDEATSALDAKTEFEVVNAIRERGIACIVVAHRLSTIRDCDEIIVLDHGEIAERGTHDDLYSQDGLYKSLVSND